MDRTLQSKITGEEKRNKKYKILASSLFRIHISVYVNPV
jgi:hypothetical protein